ncbi:hypothetical protein CsSME_00051397 [Camellia sinensis var. sinensis]
MFGMREMFYLGERNNSQIMSLPVPKQFFHVGAILCPQCEGNGVNSVDHFNGRFKAGGLCWLCR